MHVSTALYYVDIIVYVWILHWRLKCKIAYGSPTFFRQIRKLTRA